MKELIINGVQTQRLKHDLTQEQLAQKLGISRQTVIAIEKGHYTPSVLLALKIAGVFNKKVEELFRISHEK